MQDAHIHTWWWWPVKPGLSDRYTNLKTITLGVSAKRHDGTKDTGTRYLALE